MNYKEPVIVEHLAFLSVKYDVFLSELYQAIVSARAAGKSVCEELLIEYRGTAEKEAIFLITKDSKVVVQFRVAENFLARKEIFFESWLDTDKIRNQIKRQNLASPHSAFIQNLRHGMKKVNLEAEIVEIQKPQLIHTQYGNSFLLTNVVISDATGKVKLCLWGEQSHSVAVGDVVQVKNASVHTYNGERQIRLGRAGTINVLQNKAKEQKTILATP